MNVFAKNNEKTHLTYIWYDFFVIVVQEIEISFSCC